MSIPSGDSRCCVGLLFRTNQHKIVSLKFLGSASATQMKDFMEALPVTCKEFFPKSSCPCYAKSGIRPLPADVREYYGLGNNHVLWDHFVCLAEVLLSHKLIIE